MIAQGFDGAEQAQIDLKTVERPQIVIIGGGYAGMAVALRLARHSEAEIHLVNPQRRFVERIRLHQVAAGQTLRTIDIPHLLRGKGIVFHAAWVAQIDPETRQVRLSNSDLLAYDRLVYALGSRIDFSVPGARAYGMAVANLDASERIDARLSALPARSRVVVVGGGLTGMELSTELAERYPHLAWQVVTRAAYADGYAPGACDYFRAALAQRGIDLLTGVSVQEVTPDHLVTEQGDIPFELCLWAGSFRAPALGRESGLAVNARDQVLVDATLRAVGAPDIYVAGDSAALPASYTPQLVMGCKTAMPQGFQVADNLLAELRGEAPQPLRFAYVLTCVSLGRHDGLVQLLAADGSPHARFFTGRLAAWVKELICRSTVTSLQLERWFDFYDWFRPRTPTNADGAAHEPAAHAPSVVTGASGHSA